jgi:HEAT repeat protein
VPALIEGLKDPAAQAEAVQALGSIGPEAGAAVKSLAGLLEEKDERLRVLAAVALTGIGTEEAVAAVPVSVLLAALRKEEGTDGEAAAASHFSTTDVVTALGELGVRAAESVPLLVKLLDSEDAGVIQSAARALGRFGPSGKESVPHLIEVLKHEEPWVRQEAVEALGNIGPQAAAAVPALTEALKDDDRSVRQAAAAALKKIQGER